MEILDNKEYECIEKDLNKKHSYISLIRQIFVCSGVTSYFFIHGLILGAPTVYIAQIRREANSTEAISMSTASWLSSISSYSSVPWTIVLTLLAKNYGRKVPYTILWFSTFAGATLFYFSTSVTELLVSGIFQGVLSATLITVSIMILTEYTSPRYRGIFMTFKSATIYWGIWVSNVIGTFFHWRNIGILILICCVYNLTTLFWPESPYWLASKGRFRQCAIYHRWLKGDNNESKEELKHLIISQRLKLKQKNSRSEINQLNVFIQICHILKSKYFYRPITYAMITVCLYHFSGKLACSIYAIDIIKKITVRESTAYQGMLILDGITVIGMYIGCILSKFLKRRTLLLVSSSIGVTFLFILSLYLYLIKLNVIIENNYLSLMLLTSFSVTISCGPLIMTSCLSGELAPLKYRNLFLCVYALLTSLIMGTVLKISPYIFNSFGSHGAFLFYGLSASICIVILYKYLPETKDKTLQEIENAVVGNNNILNNDNEILSDSHLGVQQDHDDFVK